MDHSISVLIIGSLIWNPSEHRATWRTNRLTLESQRPVRVPIRYGRLSGTTKSKSYTMVFSNELAPNQLGRAIAVPCRYRVNTLQHLLSEAEALWAAEQRVATPTGPLAASWGAVGLLCNPNTRGMKKLTALWARHVQHEDAIYRNFPHANGEMPALNPDGLLTIAWPLTEAREPLDVDLLLATATVPELLADGRYASPAEVAAAWKKHPERRNYFDENRRNGITTSFDNEILQSLGGA